MYTPSRQFSKYNTSDETDTAVITIMVTESTANMLGMEKNIRLEDIDETEPHIHRILPNLHKFNSSSAETKYWFMSSTGHNATHNFYISQVMTDIAFFIDPQKFRNTESDSSIESVNDIDVDSVEDDNIKFEEEDHAILQKQKVLVRPLVTIKNSVQSNHLSWDANVIYVSRVDSLVRNVKKYRSITIKKLNESCRLK